MKSSLIKQLMSLLVLNNKCVLFLFNSPLIVLGMIQD